ncbi:hypothetical protein P7K49_007907 [Saguinus oedipus]|uniref:Fibronectin type-III domain-containing protein n=1 Tax=Saguinus oedipus TaxID=9490 RepID=A0ABQ9VW75_SAGOE|nr:hypothetical protein P7K49_007907 [Saguinus oedipus]
MTLNSFSGTLGGTRPDSTHFLSRHLRGAGPSVPRNPSQPHLFKAFSDGLSGAADGHAKAYSPEFYFDTPNPTRSHKLSKNYSYVLQWTQREPDAVDPVLNYRLSVRQASGNSLCLQLNQHNAVVKAIPVRRVEKGQLLEYILTDLRVPHSYEVRLTPYTTFGAGDMASRIIHYTERRPDPLAPSPALRTLSSGPKQGILCRAPHLSSDLVSLLAFSAINSPNLSGTQRLSW